MSFVAGLVLWTLLEYLLHRFVFHERVLGARMALEHTDHHAKVDWFAPWSSKIALAVPVVSAVAALSWALGVWSAAGLVGGLLSGWLAYEALHRHLHAAGPRNAYGRWARRHHFHHHFVNPHQNHGVTSPVWDLVFRTWAPVERVVVPAKQADRLPWLLGPDGEIAPAVADLFELGLRRTR